VVTKKRTGERIKSSRTEVCRVYDSSLSIQITHSIAQIELLNSQSERVEAEMKDIMKFNASVIMTIPGIGYINGGRILAKSVIFTVSQTLVNCWHLHV
jgi:transposase